MNKYSEYIPSDEEIKNVEDWMNRNLDAATKSYHMNHKWVSYGITLSSITTMEDFYRSKYFGYFLPTKNILGESVTSFANVKVFRNKKACSKFINSGNNLICRASIGSSVSSSDNMYVVYYHPIKVGWLKNKLQFIINRFNFNKELVHLFFGITTGGFKIFPKP